MKQVAVEDIAAEIDQMAARMESESLDGPLNALLPILRDGFAGNFQRQEDSRGGGWPDRQDNLPHPLLTETGALWGATTGNGAGSVEHVSARELATGVDKGVDAGGIPGAAVHNFGYPPLNIPQREYLYASTDTLDECVESLADGALTVVFVF